MALITNAVPGAVPSSPRPLECLGSIKPIDSREREGRDEGVGRLAAGQ